MVTENEDEDSTSIETIVQDAVYCLYKPPPGETQAVDIVFFHGLQLTNYRAAYKHTWESTVQDKRICWPQTWLSSDFPKARILTVSYNSSAFNTSRNVTQPFRDIAKDVLTMLVEHAQVGQKSPVILVGHSLGGLLIKQLCAEAASFVQRSRRTGEHARRFLESTMGAFFFATPHRGAHLATEAIKHLDWFRNAAPVLQLLADAQGLAHMVEDFECVYSKYGWKTYSMMEVQPVKFMGCTRVVVKPAEGGIGLTGASDSHEYMSAGNADHISICKPSSKTDRSYLAIKGFVEGLLEEHKNAPIKQPYQVVPRLMRGSSRSEAIEYINKKAKEGAEGVKELVKAGVIEALVGLIENNMRPVQRDAIWALDSILYSSHGEGDAQTIAGDTGCIDTLLHLLHKQDDDFFLPALYCLRQLVGNHPQNCTRLSSSPFFPWLLQHLQQLINNLDTRDDSSEESIGAVDAAKEILSWTVDSTLVYMRD